MKQSRIILISIFILCVFGGGIIFILSTKKNTPPTIDPSQPVGQGTIPSGSSTFKAQSNGTLFQFFYPSTMSVFQQQNIFDLVYSYSLYLEPNKPTQPPIKLELAISIFDNSEKQLTLGQWIEAHQINSADTYGLDPNKLSQSLSEVSFTTKDLEVGGHTAKLITGKDFSSGKPSQRIIIVDKLNIVSLSYIDYTEGEIIPAFIQAASTLRFDGDFPKEDKSLASQLN